MFRSPKFPLSAVLGLASGTTTQQPTGGDTGGTAPPNAGGGGGTLTQQVAPPPNTAGAAALPQQTQVPTDPDWLPARLERERNSAAKALLKDLGVEDPKDAKAALEELKKRRDAEKSDLQKAQERLKELEPVTAQHQAALEVLKGRVAVERKTLTAEQVAAVEALAGDDPVKQLAAIDKLRPTWASAPPAPPPNTAPAGGTPAQGGTTTPVNHRAVYEQLSKTNPFAAAAYANAHVTEIYPPKT